ncbi:MAG: energy-coupling factor ABC transporter substrate-binding protein [Actinomycetota bacterium]
MTGRRDAWLLGLAAAIVAAPLVLGLPGNYQGADDQARAAISAADPGYQPWFAPLWQPPSKEVESLVFALQAALGAGVLGYVIGRIHGRRRHGP